MTLVDGPWLWLILAVVLGIAELLLPGVFLIWVAAAAALTGLATLATALPVAGQFLLFAGLALATTWVGRKAYQRNPVPSADPLLNDRVARLIGDVVELATPIVHGRGRARVGDSEWPVSGPDAPAGACMRITGVEDGVLTVRPEPEPADSADAAGIAVKKSTT